MRLKYNSPVIISYTLICCIVSILITTLDGDTSVTQKIGPIGQIFSVGGDFDFSNPISYFRIFSHIIGHINLMHFFNNFMLILLIGPILEEKYGSNKLLLMILSTAIITGIIQTLFFGSLLLGASGIAFMMIVLISMSNFKSGEVPITFLLIAFLYLGKEVLESFSVQKDSVSHFAHITGGICGGIFGFIDSSKK